MTVDLRCFNYVGLIYPISLAVITLIIGALCVKETNNVDIDDTK